jgi:hypothetical protein
MYLTEVGHGGHISFYSYSGGLVWPDALAGLELIGATAAHKIMVESLQRFPERPSVEFSAREKALDKASSSVFADLDSRLFEVGDDVEALMGAYIRAHSDEFLWTGTVTDVKHPYKFAVVDNEFKWVLKEPGEP